MFGFFRRAKYITGHYAESYSSTGIISYPAANPGGALALFIGLISFPDAKVCTVCAVFLRSFKNLHIFVKMFPMPVSKNALIRYKTIDNCLRNHYRRWTLEDLINACSDALSEYEGRDENVSRRTVQADIQMMRSDKLGYNAPIVVKKNKYYTYADPDYSITNVPLTEQDTAMMADAVGVLKQLSGFSAFAGMEDIIGRLEDHVSAVRHEKRSVIYLEKNDSLAGLQYITPLYEAISAGKPIRITYQSFRQSKPETFTFSPYVLKEFRNRWFVFGRREGKRPVLNLALDRIHAIEPAPNGAELIPMDDFNPETWFLDMIGVTKDPAMSPQIVRIWADKDTVPYIRTKPMHRSQKTVEIGEDGSGVFQLEVFLNNELEKDLLGFGERIEVLSPVSLRDKIAKRLQVASSRYKEQNGQNPH